MMTIGLYWIRPHVFMPLDSHSRSYIPKKYKINVPFLSCGGEEYLNFLKELEEVSKDIHFYEISYHAWLEADSNKLLATESYELTTDDWLNLMDDSALFIDNSMIMLKAFLNHGGKATCTELADKFGRTKNFYKNNAQILGEKVARKMVINMLDENGEGFWSSVLFIMEKASEEISGAYTWELRPELKTALEQMDLSQYPLYEKETSTIHEQSYLEGSNGNDTLNLDKEFHKYTCEDFLEEVYLSEDQHDTLRQLLKEK